MNEADRFQARKKKRMLLFCLLIINKSQPNLYSGDTSITEETLALIPRVSLNGEFTVVAKMGNDAGNVFRIFSFQSHGCDKLN